MLKPKIAIIDTDLKSLTDLLFSFNEKYDYFEFSSTDSFLNFLNKQSTNPFDLLILDTNTKGEISSSETIRHCLATNKFIDFIAISSTFTKDDLILYHNLGAVKVFEKPVNLDIINSCIENYLYESHLNNLKEDSLAVTLEISHHTDIFIEILNEFVSNKEIQQYCSKYSSDKNNTFDLKLKIKSLQDQLLTNLKIIEVLNGQKNSFSKREDIEKFII